MSEINVYDAVPVICGVCIIGFMFRSELLFVILLVTVSNNVVRNPSETVSGNANNFKSNGSSLGEFKENSLPIPRCVRIFMEYA